MIALIKVALTEKVVSGTSQWILFWNTDQQTLVLST